MPEAFMWYHIFLAAVLAIFPLHHGAAVQAVLFFSLGNV